MRVFAYLCVFILLSLVGQGDPKVIREKIASSHTRVRPTQIIELILKLHCQYLKNRGVTNLPDYCYGPARRIVPFRRMSSEI